MVLLKLVVYDGDEVVYFFVGDIQFFCVEGCYICIIMWIGKDYFLFKNLKLLEN